MKERKLLKKQMKDVGPTDKVYSLFDLEQMTEARWREERRRGMYECHDVFSDTLARLRQSLEDVWAIEYTGPVTPVAEARVSKLTFAINTLITLDDMFQGEYDTKLDKMNKEMEEDYV